MVPCAKCVICCCKHAVITHHCSTRSCCESE
jgi:hypothetical protein